MRLKLSLIICLSLLLTLTGVSADSPKTPAANGYGAADWPLYGRDLAGSHYNPLEKSLTPATASRLKVKWIFETEGDVSSQPNAP